MIISSIVQSELIYVRRQMHTRRAPTAILLRRLDHVAWVVAVLLAGRLIVLTLQQPELSYQNSRLMLEDGYALIVFALFDHFSTLYRTLLLTAQSTMRERSPGRWEALLITGISARQVLLGKLRAALALLWGDWLRLAVLRAVVVLAFSPLVLRDVLDSPFARQTATLQYAGLPGKTVLAMALVFGLTLLNGLFTAAAGLLGGMVQNRNSSALIGGLTMRLVALFVPMGALTTYAFLTVQGGSAEGSLVALLITTFADNGVLLPTLVAAPFEMIYSGYAALFLALNVAFYLLAAAGLLGLAVWLARRRGMNA